MWPFAAGGATQAYPLPLFPLKTVLFPGGVLPLKVFEQRYVEMTKQCIRDNRPFGVCLITQGEEVATAAGGMPQIATVGTLARISDWDAPQTGILQLATVGETRFRVRSHSAQRSGLLVGEVTPLDAEPQTAIREAYKPVADFLQLVASRVGPRNFPAERRYEDASWVGYRLAELLPLPLPIKQSMLEINDPDVRLRVLHTFLTQQRLL